MLCAPPSAGKSFVALDMAFHIASGRPWMGQRVQGGPVLYVAAEGATGLHNRIAALKAANPSVHDIPLALLSATLDLTNDPEAVLRLIEAAKRLQATCIVLDTLARLFPGDENNPEHMGGVLQVLGQLEAATDTLVVVIHHPPKTKGATTARGHSMMDGAVDVALYIHHEEGKRQLLSIKQKDMALGEPYDIDLKIVNLGKDSDGDPVTSCVVTSYR